MSDEKDRRFVRESIDQTLSELQGDPFLARRILAQENGKEEPIVKKKLSVGLILAAVLALLMTSAALAASLGIFGQLSTGRNNDERLPELEKVAIPLSTTLVTDDGVTVEIGQAYYEGDRVFVSYRLSGKLENVALHEGKPEQDDLVWDWNEENFVCAEQMYSDRPEVQKAIQWLDGKGQRWAEMDVAGLSDGLFFEDGAYADIIGGDMTIQPDGSILGWQECVVPKDRQADTLTLKFFLNRTHTVEWQDGTTYRASHTRGESNVIPFTISRNEHLTVLKGSSTTSAYQAKAEFAQGKVDLKGTIAITCPAEWMEAWHQEDENADLIWDWNMYRNGKKIVGEGTQGVYASEQNLMLFELLWPCQNEMNGLTLVPVYSHSGEHADEALRIDPVYPER